MATPTPRSPAWIPPFCPNPNCIYHNNSSRTWPYKKIGYFRRQTPPHRIQRFTCNGCRRTFSTQTFCSSYWQKRPDLDAKIFMRTIGGMASRQIARDLRVGPETVDRHIARLGRHCLMFHQTMMTHAAPVSEVVIDGFESFELSQYFPIHHHVVVEKDTDFFVYFTDSPLRRKGRMTAEQKRRRSELEARLGRPDPRAIEKDMREALEVALKGAVAPVVHSDDHPAYRRSIKQLRQQVQHQVTPGRAHRDRHNRMWEVNLLDLLIRHSCANHKRETLAWSKRRQASAMRLAAMLIWRNYMKGRREKVRGSPTPAMVRGMAARPVTISELLSRRLFRTHVELSPRWAMYYDGDVLTPVLGNQRRHDLRLAY